jgi:nicotinate-nucleotide pyrophosphorylase (carboxylating)
MSYVDPPAAAVREAVARALAEDLLPLGDLTSALIPPEQLAHAELVARQAGTIAGAACVIETFSQVDDAVSVEWLVGDGGAVEPGGVVARVDGPLASTLTAERTALNFLRHLSGVATATARYVAVAAKASGGKTRVLDTRKTTPGLRALEKAAVRAGGGLNHRANLSDCVMVKDNHLSGLSIGAATARSRDLWPGRPVFVECDRMEQVEEALDALADRVMLDNMPPEAVAAAVRRVAGRIEVEVTGGVTLDSVGAYAAAGADFISVGAITHSAGSLDVGLDIEPARGRGPAGGGLAP